MLNIISGKKIPVRFMDHLLRINQKLTLFRLRMQDEFEKSEVNALYIDIANDVKTSCRTAFSATDSRMAKWLGGEN